MARPDTPEDDHKPADAQTSGADTLESGSGTATEDAAAAANILAGGDDPADATESAGSESAGRQSGTDLEEDHADTAPNGPLADDPSGDAGDVKDPAFDDSAPEQAGDPAEPPHETAASEPVETGMVGAPVEAVPPPMEAEPLRDPQADMQPEIHHDEHHEEESAERSLSGTLLGLLVAALVGGGLALWAAPKVAPHLPASVAQYLVPGEAGVAEDIAALQAQIAAQEGGGAEVDALRSEVDALSAALAEVEAQAEPTDGAGAGEVQALRDEIDGRLSDLALTLSNTEARLADLEVRLDDLTGSLMETPEGAEGPTPAAVSAAVQALGARVDTLADAMPDDPLTAEDAGRFAGADDLNTLQERIATLESEVDARLAEATAARQAEIDAAQSAVTSAAIRGAAAALSSQLAAGMPYRGALTELESLSGTAAPDALAGPAETGVATPAELSAQFAAPARAAIEADIRAAAGEDTADRIAVWLSSQVSVRPTGETEGSDVPAILSRIEANVERGDLAAAEAEAQALPGPSRAALGGWLASLTERVAADTALQSYLSAATDAAGAAGAAATE